MNLDLTLALIFYTLLVIYIMKNKSKFEFHGKIIALYKTKLGLKLMDKISKICPRILKFLGGVKQELFKITWLSRKEVLISAGIVILVSIIFSLVFTLFDFVIFNTVQFVLNIGK